MESCKTFYRDHCLHGFTSGDVPATATLDACVESLHLAGTCAASLGPGTPAQDCPTPVSSGTLTACQVIDAPQEATSCEFLAPKEPPPDATGDKEASGGAGGTSSADK